MREQFLSASPMPHSLGTFLAEQESTAPGRGMISKYESRARVCVPYLLDFRDDGQNHRIALGGFEEVTAQIILDGGLHR